MIPTSLSTGSRVILWTLALFFGVAGAGALWITSLTSDTPPGPGILLGLYVDDVGLAAVVLTLAGVIVSLTELLRTPAHRTPRNVVILTLGLFSALFLIYVMLARHAQCASSLWPKTGCAV